MEVTTNTKIHLSRLDQTPSVRIDTEFDSVSYRFDTGDTSTITLFLDKTTIPLLKEMIEKIDQMIEEKRCLFNSRTESNTSSVQQM